MANRRWSKKPKAGKYVVKLNDDCLSAVFSFTPTVDLCAVKKCSENIKILAERAFKERYRKRPFIFAPKFDEYSVRADFTSAVKVLQNFGNFIRALSVHNIIDKRDGGLWGDIFNSCTALKELQISGCTLEYFKIKINQGKHLESLQFTNCANDDVAGDITSVVANFKQLKRLIIIECDCFEWNGYLEGEYPKMEEITFRNVRLPIVGFGEVYLGKFA